MNKGPEGSDVGGGGGLMDYIICQAFTIKKAKFLSLREGMNQWLRIYENHICELRLLRNEYESDLLSKEY